LNKYKPLILKNSPFVVENRKLQVENFSNGKLKMENGKLFFSSRVRIAHQKRLCAMRTLRATSEVRSNNFIHGDLSKVGRAIARHHKNFLTVLRSFIDIHSGYISKPNSGT